MKKNILLLLIFCAALQIGCVDENKDGSKKDTELSQSVKAGDSQVLERSEDLSDIIVELFGIDGATTLIFNDTAIVSVIPSYDQKLSEETRETITNVVQENDEGIKDVVIADDEKTFNEIETIIGELLNGKSYDDYVLDINKILERKSK